VLPTRWRSPPLSAGRSDVKAPLYAFDHVQRAGPWGIKACDAALQQDKFSAYGGLPIPITPSHQAPEFRPDRNWVIRSQDPNGVVSERGGIMLDGPQLNIEL